MAYGEVRTQEQAASELSKFLLASNYNGVSPLQEIIQAQITAMGRAIAQQVITDSPAVVEQIQAAAHGIVLKILADDTWLNTMLVQSIAKAIGQHVSIPECIDTAGISEEDED
jgi:hypothetical protein